MKYAFVNDYLVKEIKEVTEEEAMAVSHLFQQIMPIEGIIPEPKVGWYLSKDKLVPSYDFQDQKILDVSGADQFDISIQKRKIYSDDMMERFKKKNMTSGSINIAQAMWMHHRMRAMPVSFMHPLLTGGEVVNMTLDLMNLAVPGDIEVACISLQCIPSSQFDDMTKPYHFFNSSVRDWLVSDMKKFLGWP